MGSSGLISKEKSKVEYISLTKTFEELCPIYMSYGMSYDEFWYEDAYRTKFYLDSHKLKVKQKDEEMWMQGAYFYNALETALSHLFSKNSKAEYVKKPFSFKDEIQERKGMEEVAVFEMKQRTKALKMQGLKESPI